MIAMEFRDLTPASFLWESSQRVFWFCFLMAALISTLKKESRFCLLAQHKAL